MIERSLTLVYWAGTFRDSVLVVLSSIFIATDLLFNALGYLLIYVCTGLLFVLILHY